MDLTPDQNEVLLKFIIVVEEVMDLGADGIQALLDHVEEYGTDGDGDASQDAAVSDALSVILDQV